MKHIMTWESGVYYIWDRQEHVPLAAVYKMANGKEWGMHPFLRTANPDLFVRRSPSLAGLLIEAGFEGVVEVEE